MKRSQKNSKKYIRKNQIIKNKLINGEVATLIYGPYRRCRFIGNHRKVYKKILLAIKNKVLNIKVN